MPMTDFQRPRGTRDFEPSEMRRWRDAEGRMRRAARIFGFGEVKTPTFEHTELFKARSGEGIIDEMYVFDDKGGRSMSLRPELTASVMRWYLNDMTSAPKPLKVFYFGNCFRYERPQSGRYREFFQFGVEIIGAPLLAADAEIIAVGVACLEAAGVSGYEMRIGHIGVLRCMLGKIGLKKEAWSACLHALDKREFAAVREILAANGVSEGSARNLETLVGLKGGVEKLDEATRLAGELDGFSYLRELCARLKTMGVGHWQIDLGVVRGLDYYTGMVFETDVSSLGAEKQVCGGGSYALAEVFGGKQIESTGFAIGFDRVLLALGKQGIITDAAAPEVYVVPVGDETTIAALKFAATLRARGVTTDIELMGRNISKALKYADAIKAKRVAIIGAKEMADGTVTFKDMKTGEQTTEKMA